MYKPSYRLGDMSTKSPCYGCHDRYILCHSNCSKYVEFRNEVIAYNARLYKANRLEDDLCNTPGYAQRRMMRIKSKRR